MSDGAEESSGGEGAPAWMATFGDMMSLLLPFFILMFSMSEIKREQFLIAAQSLSVKSVPVSVRPSDPVYVVSASATQRTLPAASIPVTCWPEMHDWFDVAKSVPL